MGDPVKERAPFFSARPTLDHAPEARVPDTPTSSHSPAAPESPKPPRLPFGKALAVIVGSLLIALLVVFADSEVVRFGMDDGSDGATEVAPAVVEHQSETLDGSGDDASNALMDDPGDDGSSASADDDRLRSVEMDQTGPLDDPIQVVESVGDTDAGDRGGGLVQDAQAQNIQTNALLCDRTWQVARAIARVMIARHEAYRPTNPLPTATSCPDIWNELPIRRLTEMSFSYPTGVLGRTRYNESPCDGQPCYPRQFIMDLADEGLTSLKAGDFEHLDNWGSVTFANLDNDTSNDNTLTSIPAGVFPDGFAVYVDFSGNSQLNLEATWWSNVASVRGLWARNMGMTTARLDGTFLHNWTGLRWLDLSFNPNIGSFKRGWISNTQRGNLERLHLNGTGFRARTFAINGFDGMSNLDWIELDDNPYLKFLNTRWFRDPPLEQRGTTNQASFTRTALWITGDARLVGYFNKSADNIPDIVNAVIDIDGEPPATIDDKLRTFRPDGEADNGTAYDRMWPHWHVKGRFCPSSAPGSGQPQDCVGRARWLGDAYNDPVQAIDVCAKARPIRDDIIARLGADTDTSGEAGASGMTYSALATAHNAGDAACHEDFEVVLESHLSQLRWNHGGTGTVAPMDLRDSNISTLTPYDFHGLRFLWSLELGNFDSNPLNDNTLSNVANNVFKINPTEHRRPVPSLSVRGVTGALPTADWWAYNHENRVARLWLADTGLDGRTVAPNFLDAFSRLTYLDLGDNLRLGAINLRWFKELEDLGMGNEPDESLRFHRAGVDYYYWSESATIPDGPNRCAGSGLMKDGAALECPAGWDGNAEDLRDAIYAAMDDSSDAMIRHDWDQFAPIGHYNLCNRTRAVGIRIATDLTDATYVSDADVRTKYMSVTLPTASTCATDDWGAVPFSDTSALDYSGSNGMALDRASVRTLLGDASHAGLTGLRAEDFEGIPDLEVLDLSDNPLRNFSGTPAALFFDNDLKKLDLSDTQLRFPEQNWFEARRLGRFEELIMDRTNFGNFPEGDVGRLNNFNGLKKLSLRETNLGPVNTRWFRGLYSLEPAAAGEASLDMTDALVVGWYQNSFFNRPYQTGFGTPLSRFVLESQTDTTADPASMLEGVMREITVRAQRAGIAVSPNLAVTMRTGDEIRPARNICRRTQAVRDAIIDAMIQYRDNDALTSLPEKLPAGITHTAGQAACDPYFELTPLQAIRFMEWVFTPSSSHLPRMDLSGKGLTALASDDFEGLSNARAIDLSGNDLRALPSGIFGTGQGLQLVLDNNPNLGQIDSDWWDATDHRRVSVLHAENIGLTPDAMVGEDAGLTDLTAVNFLKLSSNAIGTYQRAWLGGLGGLRTLELANTGIRGSEMEHDAFDGSVFLYYIDLGDNPNLDTLNLRWFERTRSLNGGDGRAGMSLRLQNSFLRNYFYDADGNTVPSGADKCPDVSGVTCPAEYDDNAETLKDALTTAITAYNTAQSNVHTTNIDHEWAEFPPRGFGTHNLCDRTRAVAIRIATDLTDADIVSDAAVRTRHAGKDLPTADTCTAADWGMVPGADLAAMDYSGDEPMTLTLTAVRTLLGVDDHAGLTSLGASDFIGLRGLEALTLYDNPLTQAGIPAGVFADAELTSLEFASIDLNFPDPAWFAVGASAALTNLVFDEATLHPSVVPVALFDPFSGLQHLSLARARIGVINLRWFEALRNLDQTSDTNIMMNNALVEGWYYNDLANVEDRYGDATADTGDDFNLFRFAVAFGDTTEARGQLEMAMEQAIRDAAAGTTPAVPDDYNIDLANQEDALRPNEDALIWASRNVCRRTRQVRDEIIRGVLNYPSNRLPYTPTHTPGGEECDLAFEYTHSTPMRAQRWSWSSRGGDSGWGQRPTEPGGNLPPFNLNGVGLTELRQDDLEGLVGASAIDLANNPLLTDLPDNLFYGNQTSVRLDGNTGLSNIDEAWWNPSLRGGAGVHGSFKNMGLTADDFPNGIKHVQFTRLYLDGNQLGTFDSDWVRSKTGQQRLFLSNTELRGENLPHDAFGGMNRVQYLDLGDNPDLGFLNLAWFSPFNDFQGGGSRGNGQPLRLRGSTIEHYFRDTDGNVRPEGDDGCPDIELECPRYWNGDSQTLANAIIAGISSFHSSHSSRINHDWEEFLPNLPSADLCARIPAVRDIIVAALKVHDATTYGPLTAPSGATCEADDWGAVSSADLRALAWDYDATLSEPWENAFDLGDMTLATLPTGQFTGLLGLNALVLANTDSDMANDNTLTTLPDEVFAGAPIRHLNINGLDGLKVDSGWWDSTEVGDVDSIHARGVGLVTADMTGAGAALDDFSGLLDLDISDNAVGAFQMEWLHADARGMMQRLQLDNINFVGTNFDYNGFDDFSSLVFLSLRRNVDMDLINLRWFQELVELDGEVGTGDDRRNALWMAESVIERYFHDADGNTIPAGPNFCPDLADLRVECPERYSEVDHGSALVFGIVDASRFNNAGRGTNTNMDLQVGPESVPRGQVDIEQTATRAAERTAIAEARRTLTAIADPLTQTAIAGLPDAEMTAIIEGLPMTAQTALADRRESATALRETAIATETHVPLTLTALAHPLTQTAIAGLPAAEMTAEVADLPESVLTALSDERGSQTAAAETITATVVYVPQTLTAFSEPLTMTALAGEDPLTLTAIYEGLPMSGQDEIDMLHASATALAVSATALVTETYVPQTLTAISDPDELTVIAGLSPAEMTAIVAGLPMGVQTVVANERGSATALAETAASDAMTVEATETFVPQTLTAFAHPLTMTALAGEDALTLTAIYEGLPMSGQDAIDMLHESATALAVSATALATETHIPETLTAIADPDERTAIAGLSPAQMTAIVSELPINVQTAVADAVALETAARETVIATETFVPQTLTAIADPETQTAISMLPAADMTAVVSGLPENVQTAIANEYGSETAEAQTVIATETFVPETLTAIAHPETLTAISGLSAADMTAVVSGLPENVQTAVANERGSATALAVSATAIVTETYVPQTLTAFSDPLTMTAIAELPSAEQTAFADGLPLSGRQAISRLFASATASAEAATVQAAVDAVEMTRVVETATVAAADTATAAAEQTATEAAELTGTAVAESDMAQQTAFAETASAQSETATVAASQTGVAQTATRASELTATVNARETREAQTSTRAAELTETVEATQTAIAAAEMDLTSTRAAEQTVLSNIVDTRVAATITRISQLADDQRTAIAEETLTAGPSATRAAQTATRASEQTAEANASATRLAGTATRTADLALTAEYEAFETLVAETLTAISQLASDLRTVVAYQTQVAGPAATAAAEAELALRRRNKNATATAFATQTEVAQTATRAVEATAAAQLGVVIIPTPTNTSTPTNTPTSTPTATIVAVPSAIQPWLNRIEAQIASVSVTTGDTIRLSVDIFNRDGKVDNSIADPDHDAGLSFRWSDGGAGGSFSEPVDARRVLYRVPSSPGRYSVEAVALPDGICLTDHNDVFSGANRDPDRAACTASIEVLVARPASAPRPPPAPVNPPGVIPSALTGSDGVQYAVFTPRDGGTYTGDGGVSASAASGAVPDRQVLGVAVLRSSAGADDGLTGPSTGARLTLAGGFYDVLGIRTNGELPSRLRLADALTVCLPLPPEFAANLSDVTLVARAPEGALGVLSSTVVRQPAADGALSVCGKVSLLPATVSVAKLGVVAPTAVPAVDPTDVDTPDTGATSLGAGSAWRVLALGAVLLTLAAGVLGVRLRGGSRARARLQ